MDARYGIDDPSELLSPSLVIFRDLVRQNLDAMLTLARSPDRLRPHVKTHKMPAIVRMSEAAGIHKHKCATIAEAEMVASAGGQDVLLAYPMIGPNVGRFAKLVEAFPQTVFRTLVDHPESAKALASGLQGIPKAVPVLIDIEIGMGRTGIEPGDSAAELYALIDRLPNLMPDGLHAYDGHIHDTDVAARKQAARAGIQRTLALRDRLMKRGLAVPRLVIGGTPTFPIHAALDEPGVECSPGTSVLHDAGYGEQLPDLPFVPAALLLTRVVSMPRPGRICLDLGHKAVAADPPAGSRLKLLDLPDARPGTHSEEHLVVETARAGDLPPGSTLLAIPWHICPTCALHRFAYVIEDGKLVDRWEVGARDRVLQY